MGTEAPTEMKLSALLLASANACFYQEPAGPENFIMSGRVEWEMLMDSVMGGLSTGSLIHSLLPQFLLFYFLANLENTDEYLRWTGQLSLENNGGFAQFYGNVGRKLPGFNGVRYSARTTDPSRDFHVTYAGDMETGVMFQHPIKLDGEFKSYEMDFDDYTFQFMGWEAPWIPRPNGQLIRNVGMLIMDKNTEEFEVHIEVIEGM